MDVNESWWLRLSVGEGNLLVNTVRVVERWCGVVLVAGGGQRAAWLSPSIGVHRAISLNVSRTDWPSSHSHRRGCA